MPSAARGSDKEPIEAEGTVRRARPAGCIRGNLEAPGREEVEVKRGELKRRPKEKRRTKSMVLAITGFAFEESLLKYEADEGSTSMSTTASELSSLEV